MPHCGIAIGGLTRAAPHQHRLLDPAQRSSLVEECADRGADAVRPVIGFRADADPFALGDPVYVDHQVGVQERPLGDVELAGPSFIGAVSHRQSRLWT
jgi:hypothetical protein